DGVQKQLQQKEIEIQLVQQNQSMQVNECREQVMPSVTFYSTIGALSEFRMGEDWNLYQERLGQYFVANQVSQQRKVAVLITLVGQEAYKILRDFCDPALPESKSYEELCEILKKQFAPRVSLFKERIKFHNLNQAEKESVNEWFARIKNKAINCKFGAQLDDNIKDRFVVGLKKGKILDRVCEEDHTATLQSILEVARKKEAAVATSSKADTVDVHNIRQGKTKAAHQKKSGQEKKKSAGQHQESSEELKCVHCGGTRHIFAKCKYQAYKCKICSKVGHLAKICKSVKNTVSNTNYLESEAKNSETEIVDMYNLCNVVNSEKPLMIKVNIEDQFINMELDTGAGRSVIPEKIFKEKLRQCKLESSKVRLRMYDGSILIPEGQICVKIKYKEKIVNACLIVVRKGSRVLMGRDLMKLLKIEIASLYSLEENISLEGLLQEYKDLFKDELGKYKFEKVNLKLAREANPIFVKPRPIPLAFKEKVSEQLKELEKKGIIELTDNSEWGTPLVPIIKKDGSIRICADYKVTVNKYIEDVKHPLPRIEELFAALSGGEFFTKLDLTAAYNQLEVSEETRHVINKEGLHKDPEKVAAMVEVPTPKNKAKIKTFIGMVNYYGKFIPKLSQVLAPLYELQNSKIFKWTKNCEEAFKKIKSELISDRNLVHFNKEWKLKLVCDASEVGIGAVLLHIMPDGTEKPVAFASRVLHEAEKNYSVIHKEALAIYWAANKFYQYLVGNEFILCTDHKPLLALFGEHKGIPQMAAGRLQRWALFLSGFRYKFEHIKGIGNGGADGLSRFPRRDKIKEIEDEDYFHFVTAERMPIDAAQIRKEVRKDKVLSKVFLYTRNGWPKVVSEDVKEFSNKANKISIESELLMWGYRIIVPFKFRKALLEEIHGAHLGIAKMKAVARQYVWWPKIDKEIEGYVKQCEACRAMASNPSKSPLVKFPEAKFPFDRVHIDFAGPFKGKTYLIVIDAFTKWPEVFECLA
ncbi:PREDICTED: uncharacterized protein K02A2.6-like, partial [Trachymyrmex cornetzi]|uniref:uncharacterized protein K02A2.6-like n=1 Tax=Trachymyrmex cornetzi TaxID=471704 RepID=UPI00084F5599